MTTNNLLLEIGCEELPAKHLKPLALALTQNIEQHLNKMRLDYQDITWFATPRRLAVAIAGLASQAHEQVIARRGPALDKAFDSNENPTPAALGFAKSCHLDISEVDKVTTEQGSWLQATLTKPGEQLTTLITPLLEQAIKHLPIPKPMRWGSHQTEFIRPVHWLVVLYGAAVLDTHLLGKQSGRITYGHRFHAPEAITLAHADDYELTLHAHKVLVNFATRQDNIYQQLQTHAKRQHATLIDDQILLDEVTALVEWPRVLPISFAPHFLKLPQEVLISSIKNHQKCFHCVDEKQQLRPVCFTVSNIESLDPEQVVAGNQRVIQARLQDAEFFFKTDCQTPLSHFIEQSKTVVFHHALGSVYAKSLRLSIIAEYLADHFGADRNASKRAALLAKADLQSNMVGEFPELQGIMGRYYALTANESPTVATAIAEQYHPRFANDRIPNTTEGAALALAEKIDTLMGLFGIGQKPSGEKDPFALRRAAIGIIRIAIATPLSFSLRDALQVAHDAYQVPLTAADSIGDVQAFICERLRQWYKEQQVDDGILQAALAAQDNDIYDCSLRVKALQHFLSLPAAQALIAANKRVRNILSKTTTAVHALCFHSQSLTDPHALALAGEIEQQQAILPDLLGNRQYTAALTQLALLQPRVDAFFDNVLVMSDDHDIRNNNLALLAQLQDLFNHIAHIDKI